ncbi:Arf family guanine nucleotide exchange factor SEC7 [Lachancea thermotolerans CBS 6340]|uniref:KLTH0F09196p n=1 Tax=Lachancea thermotolerans (strain ATCC 56472 / CBS 6340 / NRRL Y-8284) TaxID=559295 RepID=C5DL15_LACTC|nr:KLTH0F09196p [Lachancea thermotolerans CBS 6340]CAR24166.1 KLTH0F09196p [Lachancea thermotolerans CBS 6340]
MTQNEAHSASSETPSAPAGEDNASIASVSVQQGVSPTSDSYARSANGGHSRQTSTASVGQHNLRSTVVLVKTTFESILQQKEIKKFSDTQKSLERSVKKLDETIASTNNDPKFLDSILIFEPLRLCCRTKATNIVIKALDCLSKLFSFQALDHSIMVNPPNSMASNDQSNAPAAGITPPPKQRLIDAAIDTITDCFEGESTDSRIELQMLRALASCILTDNAISMCHGQSLLKAIRQIYNIFIYSLSSTNQGIAQATLTQVVNSVYDKLNDGLSTAPVPNRSTSKVSLKGLPSEGSETQSPDSSKPLTLQNLENLNDEQERIVDEQQEEIEDEKALLVKDAFLVFRAMAKISAKPLENDTDMRSHAVRSKLLSLHIIHSIIKDHIDVFLSQELILPGKENSSLVDAVRQYLCLLLSRNAASPISPVFEITLEIMWLLISNLRSEFKREIPVFLTEIYFPISELKTSTAHQKRYFLSVMQRVCNDPRTLIEFYLNYDCDAHLPNVVEIIVDYLTRMALTRVEITPSQRAYYDEQRTKPLATYNLAQLPLLSISNLSSSNTTENANFPVEFALKMTSLSCMVAVLRSLSSWAHKALNPKDLNSTGSRLRATSVSTFGGRRPLSARSSTVEVNGEGVTANLDLERGEQQQNETFEEGDDPMQFENLKLRKNELQDCINIFNYKPKKGIKELVEKKFIPDDSPASIAKWLLETDGLDLAAVGDFLGEGDDRNIAIMHAFVDEFNFSKMSLVEALRIFLQKFRLPGEGQKIDRFMLKFAERYVDQNVGQFAKADTAYVLSYSIILLNTDLHSSQIKNKMTLQEFIENNAGIDNGNDLPEEYLVQVFNEIAEDEIKLQSEQHQAMLTGDVNPVQQQQSAFNFFSSRDLNREAYMQVSKEISSKTELVFKNLTKHRGKENNTYYAASHIEHVKSVFDTLWMSFLAALTPPFKEYDDSVTTDMCLEGIRISIKISATFGNDYARTSFVGALVQFANLQNVQEIKAKNINATIVLLELALTEGNFLKESWKDVLLVVSQVERLQLISKGVDGQTLPDVSQARLANSRSSFDSTRSASMGFFERWTKKSTPIELAQEKHHNQILTPEISKYISSSHLVVLIDRIFTNSSNLTGAAIVEFIKALTEVSFEEIESSQNAASPRMFSIQKMVDVCYYNMDRIRLEWTPIWAVMGEAFNRIGTNPNLAVVFFAIDSLRQLSMRFLDIEELSGFEFQHDFLKPFEYITYNTTDTEVQEMCVECFKNFILTKSSKIKSGWKPILESLQYAAKSPKETIVVKTYQLVADDIVRNNFESVFSQDNSFNDLVAILKEITKNQKFQKLALHALEVLKKITQKVADVCFKKDAAALLHGKDLFHDVWFPVLFCFNDTIMTAEDLEVRSRALNYMFDALVAYGGEFDDSFWTSICTKLLFPIFGVLSKHWEVNQFNSHDDLSVWLSTTLIQALRNMVALFTHYFSCLNKMLDGFLGLLVSCICQENDTIARIGRSCLQHLILQNISKFDDTHWSQITAAFSRLFELTTAHELFDMDPLHQGRRQSESAAKSENAATVEEEVERAHQEEEGEDVGNVDTEAEKPSKRLVKTKSSEDLRRRLSAKNAIVVKCVLQLLMIESLSELFEDDGFSNHIPYKESIKLTNLLQNTYEFARDFNDDFELRTRLLNARLVDKIPNLTKQETSASAVLINIMFKLFLNSEKESKDEKKKLSERLISISVRVVQKYVSLDDRSTERDINAWRPVVVEILQGYYEFDDSDFKENCPVMYELAMQILDKSVPTDLRLAIKDFLTRVGELYL